MHVSHGHYMSTRVRSDQTMMTVHLRTAAQAFLQYDQVLQIAGITTCVCVRVASVSPAICVSGCGYVPGGRWTALAHFFPGGRYTPSETAAFD